MIGKTILHYNIIEKLGEARLHFGSVGQGMPNYALRLVLRSFSEGGSHLIAVAWGNNDW